MSNSAKITSKAKNKDEMKGNDEANLDDCNDNEPQSHQIVSTTKTAVTEAQTQDKATQRHLEETKFGSVPHTSPAQDTAVGQEGEEYQKDNALDANEEQQTCIDHSFQVEQVHPGAFRVAGIDGSNDEDGSETVYDSLGDITTVRSDDHDTVEPIPIEARLYADDALHDRVAELEAQTRRLETQNLPAADPVTNEQSRENKWWWPASRSKRLGISAACLAALVAVALAVGLVFRGNQTRETQTTDVASVPNEPNASPIAMPTVSPLEELKSFLSSVSSDKGAALSDATSPQFQALMWLSKNRNLFEYSDERKSQRYALASFYYSTNGDSWTRNDRWLSNDDECRWYTDPWEGVSVCSEDGRIQVINLGSGNLAGTLPPELALLSNGLVFFQLGENVLTGNIPSEIGLLTGLVGVWLNTNSLSGTIPSEIGRMTLMDHMNLNDNGLTGSLPTEVGLLTAMTQLYVWRNELTGQIPRGVANMTNLWLLALFGNKLTGPIPSGIGGITSMTNLNHLWLHDNNFTGTLPEGITQSPSLTEVSLDRNSLTGTIPPFSSSSRIKTFYLHDNLLEGVLPTELGFLSSMDTLSLSWNHFTGQIPSELVNCVNLQRLWLQDMRLTGNMASVVDSLPRSLNLLRLDENIFSGTVPSTIGSFTQMEYLYLQYNGLYGTIPTELGLLTNLLQLYLNSNEFDGPVPTYLGNLPNLTTLVLSDNNFTKTAMLCNQTFELFAVNTCSDTKIECLCCTHCCNSDPFECTPTVVPEF